MFWQLLDYILLFFIYACLGWGCEVAYAAVKQGEFVNRGFLNGPICPIYGFGVIGVVLALAPARENLWLLYLGSFALTTLIEFVTGFALEKLFHARWWDYSNAPLNIMGYVCLPFSLVWGAACLVIVRWVHPLFERAVAWLPNAACAALDGLFLAVFLLDVCATVSAVRKLSERLRRLTEIGGELHAVSDEIGKQISGTTLAARKAVLDGEETLEGRREALQQQFVQRETQIADWLDQQRAQKNERAEAIRVRFEGIRERFNRVLEEKGFGHRRLLNAFPNLRSERYQEAVESLRAFYRRKRGK
ncbi:MAG: hypothetical protein IJ769_07410 [Clostridia bacterium]|nr:hypothetical protein [Clostridia bacterium]